MKHLQFSAIRYGLELAWKDLRHNGVSTVLIILVIAAVCLPMLLVSSLREGYIGILRRSIENSSQATRIDVAVSSQRAQEQYMTEEVLARFRERREIREVVPQKSRTVYLLDSDGRQIDFEAITTIPEDPDLDRFGFQGTYSASDNDDLAVVVRQKDVLQELGLAEVPETLDVIVTRTVRGRTESYVLESKVLGYLEGGPSRTLMIPVNMGNKLERWILGFGVPEYGLPSAPDREEALGEPVATSGLAISPIEIPESMKQPLGRLELELGEHQKYSDGLHTYVLHPRREGETLTEGSRSTAAAALSERTEVRVVPNLEPLQMSLADRTLSVNPSMTGDPRAQFLLAVGHWLNTYRNRFEIVVPRAWWIASCAPSGDEESEEVAEDCSESGPPIPATITGQIGGQDVELTVTGLSRDDQAYLDFTLLFRLSQVASGEAIYDVAFKTFDVNGKSPYEDRFLIARVHVHRVREILEAVRFFEEQGYEIYASSRADVQSLERTMKILTNLMILVGLTGAFAGISSLFVLMYEAIKRKRGEIGIMRAMGLPKTFITRMVVLQALFYGLFGFLTSLAIFIVVRLMLDSSIGHAMLSTQGLEGTVFSLSLWMIAGFLLSVLAVSSIAGRLAAQSARKIDPADILSEN